MLVFVALCLLVTVSSESVNTSSPQLVPTRPTPPPLPTRPAPSPPPRPAFEDLVVQFYDKNVSTYDLLRRLNMTSGGFDLRNICPSFQYSCEFVCPFDTEERERDLEKPCYCDELCIELGDCCYDYFSRCATPNTPKSLISHLKRACVKTAKSARDHGYSLIGSCPPHNTDKRLESLCTAKSSTADLFGMLPVSDFIDKIDYKNVFCARCNHAKNQTYWKFSASCESALDLPRNRSLMLQYIMSSCEWSFEPPSDYNNHSKRCLAVQEICPHLELVQKEPLLPDLCSFYAFPVCYNVRTKNPHCEICKGNDISRYWCRCQTPSPPVPTAPGSIPSLDILFHFSSSSHIIKVGNQETIVKNKVCTEDFVFDPFVEKCVQIHVDIPNKGLENGTYVNCSFIEINVSLAALLPNGSVWIPSHKSIYSNESYFILGSSLFLCIDLKHSYTDTEVFVSTKITLLQILTYIGCAISMISLIFLLAIYIALPELRTLPGRNLISLSCAMLLYHIFFLLTGQADKPYICMAVSLLLHYFLLSSFCWMGVMAFDVAKTFGATGQATRFRPSDSRNKLIAYSIFAWITPAVIVIISVTLDKTNTIIVRYGDAFCWISNGTALLVVLGVPVALILLFNILALTLTLVSIWKVQKSTRRVTDQSNQSSLPILYIKLSSAMGFTWILGFIVPFTQVELLDYLFVILNSLQGFLIFLAFAANKRTINKVKAGWSLRLSQLKETTSSQSRQTRTNKLVTTAL